MLALKLKPAIAAKAKEQQGTRTDLTSVRNLTNVDTKKEIAQAAGVSHDTIAKVERIEQQATPEIKAALKSGEFFNQLPKATSNNNISGRAKDDNQIPAARKLDTEIHHGGG